MTDHKAHILVEASPAFFKNKSGVGHYVSDLLNALAKNKPSNYDLSYYYFDLLKRGRKQKLYPGARAKPIHYMPGKLISLFKKFGSLPPLYIYVRKQYDLVLFTNYVPLSLGKRTKCAIIIYDLGFIDCPQYVQEKNLHFLRKFSAPAIAKSDLIITISNYTKQRLLTVFPQTKGKVVVTHIPPANKPIGDARLSERLVSKSVVSKKYLLYLGTLEPRKNICNLIDAYEQLPKKLQAEYSLVLAGGRGWKDDEIITKINNAINRGINVITTGYVNHAEKAALYNNAAVFVLPSHYEGFGMPILEAMQYNIPIAVSDIEVFHEVAGDTVCYFDKNSAQSIADTISQLLTDNALRKKLVSRYGKQLLKYSWDKNALTVYKAFDNILKE